MNDLTPEQLAVVLNNERQLTVQAAAGSGKTKTLVARYLRFVTEDGLRPDQVLTITFTRKAAAEMKERIVKSLRESGRNEAAQVAETGPIQTIHGFCERMLRENSIFAGIDPNFQVMDEGVSSHIREVALRLELQSEFTDNPWVEALVNARAGHREWRGSGGLLDSLSKNIAHILAKLRGTTQSREQLIAIYADPDHLSRYLIETVEARGFGSVGEEIRALLTFGGESTKGVTERQALENACGLMHIALSVWTRMEHEMDRLQEFDFSELERRAVRLLETSEPARDRIQNQYHAVLVDEAQDLNPMQYRLIESLNLNSEMLVGDPQQSIYSFRQADPGQFIFRSQTTTTLRLSSNFRSSKEILDFVDRLFEKFWPDYNSMSGNLADPGKVEAWKLLEYDTELVADMVQTAVSHAVEGKEVAVLYRKIFRAKQLPAALAKRGIPSRIIGGRDGFFGRLHVRDLANTLQALAEPESDFALLTLLRSPIVGVTLDGVVLLAAHRKRENMPVYLALENPTNLSPEDQAKLVTFREWFEPLRVIADRLSAWEVISEVLRKSPYLEKIARQPHGIQAIANIRKLLIMAVEMRELGPIEFAEYIRTIKDLRSKEGDAPAVDDDKDTVQILTIHKAKGLEFDAVVMADLFDRQAKAAGESGILVDQDSGLIFPKFGQSTSEGYRWYQARVLQHQQAEEQRVLYVAMTRAKRFLFVAANPDLNSDHNPFAQKIANLIEMNKGGDPGYEIREINYPEPAS